MTPEFDKAAADLAAWGQEEGAATFVIHTTDEGNVRLIGPRLQPSLVARMLRSAAQVVEERMIEGTVQ